MTGTRELEKSPYSFHFNVLRNLGGWILETKNPLIKNAYVFVETCMFFGCSYVCYLLFMNLYTVYGDIRKMAWNLCVTVLFPGWFVKHVYTLHRCDVVNSLRRRLHRRETSRVTQDDEQVNRSSARELKRIEILFYAGMVVFIPMWLISWYFGLMWGERDIPLPISLPIEIDYEDEFQFNISFLVVSILGVVGIFFAVTVEMAMFTILIQISREYKRLTKHVAKINEFCGAGCKSSRKETNPYLRDIKIKKLLDEIITRQQELIKCTRDFELIYNYPMLLQFFLVSLLFVVCAILSVMDFENMNWNALYLLGYPIIILLDMLGFCWFATRIRAQCLNVGDAAYSVLWYRMGIDVQKNISMIIMRSQHPPKITSGKIIEMDLYAFIIMVRNICSWLTLYKQVTYKSD